MKPGYKMTDAGLIPSDWVDYTVGDLIAFEGGSQPDKSHFKQSWNPGYVRLIQIRDYKSNKYETYVPSNLVRRFCDENDIMIGRYGPPVFQILKGISGAYNVALIKATPTSQLNKKYAYYFLKQDSLFTFVDKLSQRSSGQTGVDLKELKAYPLSLPPTKIEQEAIAEALSDADALIESLDQLIAKKRQIKQGAMQELLTGKRRLPGFSGEWTEVAIKKIVQTPVTDGPHLTPVFLDDGVPFLSVNNLVDGRIDFSDLRYISVRDHEEFSKKCKPQVEDILLGKAASVGKVALVETDVEFNIWSPIALIRVNSKHHAKFVYYQLQGANLNRQIALLTNSSSQGNIGMGDIEKLVLPLPDKDEQLAIATVLSDMDTELAALDSRLAKARQIKQGMMQELLTGRIRLL